MQRNLASFCNVDQMRHEIKEKLAGYQTKRVEAAVRERRLLIADETGMGKSAPALVALEEDGAYPAILVTPATAEDSLLAECRKWVPWRTAAIASDGRLPAADIVILHPEVLERYVNPILAIKPRGVILDESHYFKNHLSSRSQAAKTIVANCPLRILMSATPIKNRRRDLLNQLDLLGRTHEVLTKAYGLARLRVPKLDTMQEMAAALARVPRESLHRALEATVMLRTTHVKEKTGLSTVRRHYVKCTEVDSLEYAQLEAEFIAYCKEMSMIELDDHQTRAKANIRVSGMVNRMRLALGMAKVARTIKWAAKLRAEGRKGVIFSYRKDVVYQLCHQLPGRSIAITGDTPKRERQAQVKAFAKADFLVATMDCLAHGVNGIQQHAADVAFVELDHTHSKHEQAEGRLRRRGQRNRAQSYYFVAPNTIDEALLARLRTKWKDAQGILDGKEASRSGNFAEQILQGIIAQRPWEKGGKIDWKAAVRVQRGNAVEKPGRNGALRGTVIWVNGDSTSCRVEWEDGLVTFETPEHLRLVGLPKGRAKASAPAIEPLAAAGASGVLAAAEPVAHA